MQDGRRVNSYEKVFKSTGSSNKGRVVLENFIFNI